MDNQQLNVFYEDLNSEDLNLALNINWLTNSLLSLSRSKFEINYIFCSDEFLLQVNKDYLNHDYYTDIITFNNSEENSDVLESDIFISIDRVRENAKENQASFESEIDRVMIHGILHLVGFNDKTDEEQDTMTKMEDKYLALRA